RSRLLRPCGNGLRLRATGATARSLRANCRRPASVVPGGPPLLDGLPGGLVLERAFWPRQPEMLAQRLAFIGGSKQAAPLQKRDHLRAEDVKHCGEDWRHDVEAIRRAVDEPIHDQI